MARKKIGIALSGGGARGFAHIGVLKVLEAHRIPIDFVAGTSAGSFIGAALACGMPIAEIDRIAHKIGWLNMFRPSFSPKAVLSNAPMGKFIKEYFPYSRFENLPIPYCAVAFDLKTNQEVEFKDAGDIAFAVRSSCSVPGIFSPLVDEQNGHPYVDGGLSSLLPAKNVRNMGADFVIGIDVVSSGVIFPKLPKTIFGYVFQSTMVLLQTAAIDNQRHADFVLEPAIEHIKPTEISKIDELIELGEISALSQIDRLKSAILA